jgi:hypothetical protein
MHAMHAFDDVSWSEVPVAIATTPEVHTERRNKDQLL